MFEGIREKVHSVQENFSSSFRILNVSTEVPFVKKCEFKNVHAGSEMLQKYLTQWNHVHTLSEENANKAEEIDEKINAINIYTNAQLSEMMKLCFSINLIPKLVKRTQVIINQTKKLDLLFQDIEKSLAYLEEITQIQKVQEKQLEHRFKLAMHKESKMGQLETLRGCLESNYNEQVKQAEEKKAILLRERQKTFEEAFQQDLQLYKQSGNLNIINTNKSPAASKVTSLEDVDLEVDNSELNEMLFDMGP